MKIKRVIVDEVPEGCRLCKFLSQRVKGRSYYWECDIVDKWIDNGEARPNWCPLETDGSQLIQAYNEFGEAVKNALDKFNNKEA